MKNKKAIFITVLAIVIFTIVLIVLLTGLKTKGKVALTTDESTITDQEIHYIITNNTNKKIMTGEPFALFKLENNKWEELQFKDHVAFPLYGIVVEDEYESNIDLSILADKLGTGKYKLQKRYFFQKRNGEYSRRGHICECEFEIA